MKGCAPNYYPTRPRCVCFAQKDKVSVVIFWKNAQMTF